MIRRAIIAVGVTLALALSSEGHAAPILTANDSVTAVVYPGESASVGDQSSSSTGALLQVGTNSGSCVACAGAGLNDKSQAELDASASAQAIAGYGVLKISAESSAKIQVGTPNPYYGAGVSAASILGSAASQDIVGHAQAYAIATFSDFINFSGAGLDAGAPVSIEILFSLNDNITTAGIDGCGTHGGHVTLSVYGSELTDTTCSPNSYQTGSITTTAFVGTPFELEGILVTSISADSQNGTISSATGGTCAPYQGCATQDVALDVNALDTSFVAIDVLTPDVSYIADSGTVYPTTLPAESGTDVPEPSTLLLMVSASVGTFLITWLSSRRGKRRLISPFAPLKA